MLNKIMSKLQQMEHLSIWMGNNEKFWCFFQCVLTVFSNFERLSKGLFY